MSTDERNINTQAHRERRAATTAGLGVILSEHEKWELAEQRPHYWAARCQCGEWVALHRQHVAAVVLEALAEQAQRERHEADDMSGSAALIADHAQDWLRAKAEAARQA